MRGKTRLRANLKSDAVTGWLRARIVDGTFPSGARLPTRVELEQQFECSWLTIQSAFDALRKDGFIRAAGRHGTFVVDHPPHLFHYGLVFLRRPEIPGGWARFCDNLIAASRRLMQTSPRRIAVYQGITGHEDVEDFQRLVADLRLRRLAGLVLTSPNVQQALQAALLPDTPAQGRVTIGPESSAMPTVWIDWPSFFDQAVKHLVQRGRRRIAMVSYQGFAEQYGPLFETTLARYGAATRPYWIQEPYEYYPQGITRCMHLLMHERQTERPDGLIVADDHLLEAASRGLFDAGVRVPEQAEIVAFANLPFLAPSVVPVRHLGFEVEQLLARCLDAVDRQVRGETVRPISLVPVRFSDASTDH